MIQSQNRFVLLVIVSLGIILNIKHINEFPSHIHAWAQSDRYALAVGFTNNNLNFFKPQNLIYNHLFPGDFTVPSDRTETAVYFPIHDYIPAIIMKVFKDDSPWIFRTYILLYSFLGLYVLFRLGYLLTGNEFRSLFVVIFGATSPVFVYYQAGFLPTIPSLANVIIGIYFYAKYRESLRSKYFITSIVFFTLATLSRLAFAIPFIAVLSLEILPYLLHKMVPGADPDSYRDLVGQPKPARTQSSTTLLRGQADTDGNIRQGYKSKIVSIAGCMVLLTGSFIYTSSLRDRYGSDFLNRPMPPENLSETWALIRSTFNHWGTDYFSTYHYGVLLLLILITLLMRIRRRNILAPVTTMVKWMGALTMIMFTGCVLLSILMLRQFPAHDYYFLDTFFLPILLLIMVVLSLWPNSPDSKTYQLISIASVSIICIPMVLIAGKSQTDRRNAPLWDRTSKAISNFEGSGSFLDSLGIDQDARILALDANVPNAPFLLMGRRGYPVMSTTRENMMNSLTWNFDYIAIQNDYFVSDIYSVYPEIINQIEKVADNRKISIFTLTEESEGPRNLSEFWGLDTALPIFQEAMNYDSISDFSGWKNIETTTDTAYSGFHSGVINPDKEYGLTFSSSGIEGLREDPCILYISAYFLANTLKDLMMVVDLSIDGEKTYYRTVQVDDFIKPGRKWEYVDLLFQLPKADQGEAQLNIFLWNKGKNQLYLDDFTISVYNPK